jgi:hypothetical protein
LNDILTPTNDDIFCPAEQFPPGALNEMKHLQVKRHPVKVATVPNIGPQPVAALPQGRTEAHLAGCPGVNFGTVEDREYYVGLTNPVFIALANVGRNLPERGNPVRDVHDVLRLADSLVEVLLFPGVENSAALGNQYRFDFLSIGIVL